MNNRASDCWTIVSATVDKFCQQLWNNCASDCWKIVLVTAEELCQRPLQKRASNCWTIVLATVEQLSQRLLKRHGSNCWRIILEQLCQCLLNSTLLVNNRASLVTAKTCACDDSINHTTVELLGYDYWWSCQLLLYNSTN